MAYNTFTIFSHPNILMAEYKSGGDLFSFVMKSDCTGTMPFMTRPNYGTNFYLEYHRSACEIYWIPKKTLDRKHNCGEYPEGKINKESTAEQSETTLNINSSTVIF